MRHALIRLAGVILAWALCVSPVAAQSFSDRLHHDRFDFAGSDVDGDRVPNDRDRCNTYTLTENPPLFEGCNALDLMDRPFRVVDPIIGELDKVRTRLQGLVDNLGISEMRPVASDIVAAMNAMKSAAFDIQAGNVCQQRVSVGQFGDALGPAESALTELRSRIAERLEGLPDTRPDDEYADHTSEDLVLLNMQMAEFDLSRTHAHGAELAAVYDQQCAENVQFDEVEDIIVAFDPSLHRILMKSGREVALSSHFSGIDALYAGRKVLIQGQNVGQDYILAESITGTGVQEALDPSVTPIDCVKLHVVPVQRQAPFYSGPFMHHDPSGYVDSHGRYVFEEGTGFVADASSCPEPDGGAGSSYARYSLVLELEYNHVQHGMMTKTLAHDLHSQYSPVYLPVGMSTLSVATLTVTKRWQSCTDPGTPLPPNPDDCSEPVLFSTDVMTLRMYDRGSLCHVDYESTEFRLEDDDTTGFRRTRVHGSDLLAPFTGTISHTFKAEGYASPSSGASSFPYPLAITGNDYFAIHNQDFFKPDVLFTSAMTGVDKPSGLRWPRLAGDNNGQPFSYSCKLPAIIRDVVHFCSGAPNSYYRLPFSGDYPTWHMGQGNNGSFTHNGAQAFALDFLSASGTPILAGRGGTVVFVREDESGNSFDDPDCGCNANVVVIRHQDGSEGAYFHMPLNGIFRPVGAKVKRGDLIGEVGNTGWSTTPHLHFHEQIANSGGMTSPSRFQAYSAEPPAPLLNCWVPDTGDKLYSNNGE